MIALDVQPMSVVEDIGFMKLMNVHSLSEILTTKHENYYKLSHKLKKKKIDLIEYCALTTDIWTSRQTLGYICNSYLSLYRWSVESMFFCVGHQRDAQQPHCGEYYKFHKTLVTNNPAKIVAAIRLNGWKHIPCFAHTSNLDPVMDDVSKKCLYIASYFHCSYKATRETNRNLNLSWTEKLQVHTRHLN